MECDSVDRGEASRSIFLLSISNGEAVLLAHGPRVEYRVSKPVILSADCTLEPPGGAFPKIYHAVDPDPKSN